MRTVSLQEAARIVLGLEGRACETCLWYCVPGVKMAAGLYKGNVDNCLQPEYRETGEKNCINLDYKKWEPWLETSDGS